MTRARNPLAEIDLMAETITELMGVMAQLSKMTRENSRAQARTIDGILDCLAKVTETVEVLATRVRMLELDRTSGGQAGGEWEPL